MTYLNIKRHFGRILVLAAIICCGSLYASSQTEAVAPAGAVASKGAMAIVETFFKKYKEDGTSAAVDYLFGTNKYITNVAGINQLKAKLDTLRATTLGLYIGKELITQKTASNSLVFYSILVKNEIQPIRFTFIFYKPKNDWVLYRFKFDDQLDTELEDAGKIGNKHP